MVPALSIVVVAYGKRPYSERCLESLDAAFGKRLGRDVELVLVDNASPDDTLELFRAWEPRARVLELPENRNFAGGYNAGAAAARGETLVLLNNDTRVPPGALEVLAEQAREPDVGLVGVRLEYPDGRLQHGGFGWRAGTSGLIPYHLFQWDRADLPAARCSFDLDSVTAACIATRRELFCELGGFDEGFVNGWEDVDLCLRVRSRGLRVVYRGDVSVIHDEGGTSGGNYSSNDNVRLFASRWGELLEPDDELLRTVFDAEANPLIDAGVRGARHPRGAELVVEGHLSGLSPEGDEARALLAALEAAGHEPAGRDVADTAVSPRLDVAERERLTAALARPARPLARTVRVEAATEPAWPPPIAPYPARPGGEGLLAVLPAHDLARSELVLDALPHTAVTLLPTACTPMLEALAAEHAPRAELLDPISSEAAFAELASRFDVVLCADSDDVRQRRALVAAATGALPLVLAPGPATAVLGIEAVPAESTALEDVLEKALVRADADEAGSNRDAAGLTDDDSERARRRELVRDRCDLQTIGELAASAARSPSGRAPDPERPSILVVNASPPTPDVNSASVRLRRLLELMLDQGYDVTFVGRDGRDHERQLAELDTLGIEAYATDPERLAARGRAVLAPPLDLEAILAERFHDIAWLVTWHVAEQYLPEVRRHSPLTRVVVDSEDVHFLRELRGAELSDDPAERERAEATRVREQAVYAQADALVAVSEQDATVLSELAPGIPTAVVSNIHDPEPAGPGFEERAGLLFVGSFWHAPNVDAVLWLAHEVLPLIRERLPNVRVRIVGAGAPGPIRALASDGIEIAGQVPDLRPDLESARVSLAPLRYGAGVKGKVGEAMAFGLPVVTTTVGAEGMGIEPGRHALVADDPRAFADAIVEAHERRELWKPLRDAGRELIAARQGREPAARALAELDARLRPRTTYLATPDWGDAASVRAAIEPYVTRFAPSDPVSLTLCTGATGVSPGDAFAAVTAALAEIDRDPTSVPDMVVTALDPTRHPLPREAFALDRLEQPAPRDLPSASVRHAL